MKSLIERRISIQTHLRECAQHAAAEKMKDGPYSDWYGYALALIADLNHVNELIAAREGQIRCETASGSCLFSEDLY